MSKHINKEKRVITETSLKYYRRMLIEDEKSPATVEKYMHDIENFAGFMEGRKVTKVLVIDYKQALLSDNRYAPRTINSRLAAVNSFLKHMGWHECIVKTLKIQHKAFRDGEKKLAKAEYDRLVRMAKEEGKERICLVMQTICATGIRVSELRYITVEAVKAGHAEINMKGKVRKILILVDLQKLLISYIKMANEENPGSNDGRNKAEIKYMPGENKEIPMAAEVRTEYGMDDIFERLCVRDGIEHGDAD